MQPSPIAETSGPFGPSVRLFIGVLPSLEVCSRHDPRRRDQLPVYQPARPGPPRQRHARGLARVDNVGAVFPLNAPNLPTVLRIMLVPVLVVALLGNTPVGDVLAAVVFALASLTDFVDGYLARARSEVT